MWKWSFHAFPILHTHGDNSIPEKWCVPVRKTEWKNNRLWVIYNRNVPELIKYNDNSMLPATSDCLGRCGGMGAIFSARSEESCDPPISNTNPKDCIPCGPDRWRLCSSFVLSLQSCNVSDNVHPSNFVCKCGHQCTVFSHSMKCHYLDNPHNFIQNHLSSIQSPALELEKEDYTIQHHRQRKNTTPLPSMSS